MIFIASLLMVEFCFLIGFRPDCSSNTVGHVEKREENGGIGLNKLQVSHGSLALFLQSRIFPDDAFKT